MRGESFLSIFDKAQRDALAMLFLRLHSELDLAGFIFAGLWLFPFGLLVYRSRFLPRLIGIWLMLVIVGARKPSTATPTLLRPNVPTS